MPQTYEKLSADAAYLTAQHGIGTRTAFAEMEQALGIVYEPSGLPFGSMSSVARIPETRYCNWMHNLCASGGMCQYQVNQFCLALEGEGFSLAHLDEFQQAIKLPTSQTRLRRVFFQDRVARSQTAHIKAFAGEILTAIVVLGLFSKLILQPIGKMQTHTSLLSCMSDILGTLRLGDRAALHVAHLKALCLRHHQEFKDIMPQCMKPKLHFLHHTPLQIEHHQRNLSCFGPERKHQTNKQALGYIFPPYGDSSRHSQRRRDVEACPRERDFPGVPTLRDTPISPPEPPWYGPSAEHGGSGSCPPSAQLHRCTLSGWRAPPWRYVRLEERGRDDLCLRGLLLRSGR